MRIPHPKPLHPFSPGRAIGGLFIASFSAFSSPEHLATPPWAFSWPVQLAAPLRSGGFGPQGPQGLPPSPSSPQGASPLARAAASEAAAAERSGSVWAAVFSNSAKKASSLARAAATEAAASERSADEDAAGQVDAYLVHWSWGSYRRGDARCWSHVFTHRNRRRVGDGRYGRHGLDHWTLGFQR